MCINRKREWTESQNILVRRELNSEISFLHFDLYVQGYIDNQKVNFYELDFLEQLIKILITKSVKVKLDVEAKNFLAQNCMCFPLFILKYQEFPSCWHLLNLVMNSLQK